LNSPEEFFRTRLGLGSSEQRNREDKDAAREALSVIQGNYAPEIISAPDAFQDIAQVG
jgi:hypothetical protein